MNPHTPSLFLNRFVFSGMFFFLASLQSLVAEGSYEYEELRRFPCIEARQAVAVDEDYFYVISNHAIGKYVKSTGERVSGWECPEGEPLTHLNSGIVIDDKLYCAHSNHPGVPMIGSIEIWDVETMKHIGSHSFGIYSGSTTWIDFYDDHWHVAFAYYGDTAAELKRDPSWTNLVKFDKEWNRKEGWVFPESVIDRFGVFSSSGGMFDDNGLLYITGHHEEEIYVLKLPKAGSTLELVETIPVSITGQGIAWDKSTPGLLYGIHKKNREVIVARLKKKL